ncbi:hypothetical protein QJQ45_026603 [Haematococcus lacustris]|nr:hypothetical protein QJQ45_026603 [Haematococcus lacustris]
MSPPGPRRRALLERHKAIPRCCHRTCSDCKDKSGVDGSIMLYVKQYAPVKQKEGPARIELQQFRLSLREVVGKLNEQMPSYIWHHFVAHHQLAVFRRLIMGGW